MFLNVSEFQDCSNELRRAWGPEGFPEAVRCFLEVPDEVVEMNLFIITVFVIVDLVFYGAGVLAARCLRGLRGGRLAGRGDPQEPPGPPELSQVLARINFNNREEELTDL